METGRSELERVIPALNASPRAKNLMEAWPRIVQFDLEGEAGPFHIIVDKGQMKLGAGVHKAPNIVVAGDTAEFANVILGKKDITHPLLFGQLRLTQGKNMEMITFARILAAITRKWGA